MLMFKSKKKKVKRRVNDVSIQSFLAPSLFLITVPNAGIRNNYQTGLVGTFYQNAVSLYQKYLLFLQEHLSVQ